MILYTIVSFTAKWHIHSKFNINFLILVHLYKTNTYIIIYKIPNNHLGQAI